MNDAVYGFFIGFVIVGVFLLVLLGLPMLERIAKAADYILVAEERCDSLGLAPRMVIIIGDKTTPQFQGKIGGKK